MKRSGCSHAAATLAAAYLALLASPAPAAGPFDLEFSPVTEGIVLGVRLDMSRYPVIGNAVLITTAAGVVLVDGGGAAPVVNQIIAKIEALDAGPLLYVIVSHWHSDHTVGLDRYLAAFPAARIVSHPWTHERIVSRLVERVGRFPERLEALRETTERELVSGIDADTGEPLPATGRRYRERILTDYPELARHAPEASAGVPQITTTGGMTLPFSDRPIEIHFVGRANTPGDLVVYLPRDRVLIVGDIVTHPVPFGYPTYPSEVIGSIEALLAFDFDHLVLGHGPTQTDRAYAEKVLALQRHTVGEIRRLNAEGLDEESIRQRLDLAPYDEAIVQGDEKVRYFFDRWYVQPIVGRAVAEIELE
ncbi:MAG: MBL fold metallo-hydrolase [Acidobacteria bacterium]|nr:MBL fold metallo-hydrolase [Acidobacteriota bacterium]